MIKDQDRDISLRIPLNAEEHERLTVLAREADTDKTKLIRSWLRREWAARSRRLAKEGAR